MAQSAPDSRAGVRDAAMIVALVLLVGVPSLFTRDLCNPDEPRYMEVAREMVVLGDYFVPHLNGEVYSEKPPMFFWLAGLLWRAGLGYSAGRIVTILAVCGTLVLVYVLCGRSAGPTAGLLAAATALSTLILLKFTKLGVLDPLLMFFVTAALLSGYRALNSQDARPVLPWLVCYVAMGFGTLTKGPVGFLVPALILLIYGMLNRRAIKAGGVAHLIGLACFVAVVLVWLVPAIAAGGPEYARTMLLKQNLGRAVRSYSHRNPFYYYLLWSPVCFFPWSLVLPFAMVGAVRQWRRGGEHLPLFASVWILVTLFFFSLISGKRINYIVPVAPAVGMLSGWYFTSGRTDKKSDVWAGRLITAAFLGVVAWTACHMAAAVLGPAIGERLYPDEDVAARMLSSRTVAHVAGAFLVLSGIMAVALWGALMPGAARLRRAATLGAAVLLLSLPFDLFVTPLLNTVKSGKGFALAVSRCAAGGKPVLMYQKDFSGVYNLYTGRVRMPVLESAEDLRDSLERVDALVIGDLKRLSKALSPAEGKARTLAQDSVGHRKMLLLRGGNLSGGGRGPSPPGDDEP